MYLLNKNVINAFYNTIKYVDFTKDMIQRSAKFFRLLLGSVNHALKFERSEIVVCQPIPLEASCHIADHIQVINIALENGIYVL